MARIDDVVADFRRRLISKEDEAVLAIVNAYSVALGGINRELIRLLEDLDREGPASPLSWLYSSGRLESLLRQTTKELADWAGLARRYIDSGQSDAVALAAVAAPAYFEARSPNPVILGQFDRLPLEALQEFVGRTQNGSPLVDVFNGYGAAGAKSVEDTLIESIALGQNPREAARILTRRLTDPDTQLPSPFDEGQKGLDRLKNRALITARTEIVGAHRNASLANYRANSDILTGWIWMATLDTRTCPVCWAMHGTKHSHNEVFGSHVQCRCSPVPDFESAEEIETGEDRFRKLDRESKNMILGPTKLELYEQGVQLRTFVFEHDDPKWGKQRVEASAERAK